MNTAQNIQSNPAAAAGVDLDNLDNLDTSAHTFNVDVILDDEGNGIAGFICVGKNSPQYLTEANNIRLENIQRSAKRKKSLDTTTPEGAKLLVDTLDKNEQRLARAVVTGWYGFNWKGVPQAFDKARADALLDKFPTWQQAISVKLEAEGNFQKV